MAKLTGITVRTLHHYNQIELLSPSKYSDAGHRLYSEMDISKLQQIMSLKQLGFSLDEVKKFFENPNYQPGEAIRMQIERLNEQIRIQEDLRNRLEELYGMICTKQDVTAQQLIKIIEVMKMFQNYFTPEQMEKIKEQGELLGQVKIKEVENEWPVLIARVRQALEKGTPPENPEVIQLAKRWRELVSMFTAGDPKITQSLTHLYQENPDTAMQYGLDGEIFNYIKQAMSYI